MKITESQLKQIIKEVLNEISGKQRSHEERVAAQKEQRVAKEAERNELRQALGNDWQVDLRMLEGRYQLTVHRAYAGEEEERPLHETVPNTRKKNKNENH